MNMEAEQQVEDMEEDPDVVRWFIDCITPTKEDLERVLTEEELKKLCLKHKCRVDMWRWNVVDDYRDAFKKAGRWQRWDDKLRIRMLARGVNMRKPGVFYKESEIKETRRKEWELQKKESIRSLDLWKYDKEKEKKKQDDVNLNSEMEEDLIRSDNNDSTNTVIEMDIETQSNVFVNSEIIDDVFGSDPEESTDTEIVMEVQPQLENLSDKQLQNLNKSSINLPDDGVQSENLLEYQLQSQSLPDSSISLSDNEHHQTAVPVLNSEEIDANIYKLFDVNTESMSLQSEFSLPSQTVGLLQNNIQASQDLLAPDYHNFNQEIPLTSTQSQSSEPQDDQVLTNENQHELR